MGDGESAQDSPREETLQNMSADDLPDSASQAAHPQDSAFSYRYFFERIANLWVWTFHQHCCHCKSGFIEPSSKCIKQGSRLGGSFS